VTQGHHWSSICACQLRCAAAKGCVAQDELSIQGHASKARLYARMLPKKGFLPATGTLNHLQFTPRVACGQRRGAGDTISPFYDPDDRQGNRAWRHARDRLVGVCAHPKRVRGRGGRLTTFAFLGALARPRRLCCGGVDTGRSARYRSVNPSPRGQRAIAAPCGMAALSLLTRSRAAGFTPVQPLRREVGLNWGVRGSSAASRRWYRPIIKSGPLAGRSYRQRIGGRWFLWGGATRAAVLSQRGCDRVWTGYGLVF